MQEGGGTMQVTEHALGKIVTTDVLVLGAGASGCGAALGARAGGQSVLLLDKGKLESAGACGGGNDHFMVVLEEDGPTDTPEAFIDFMLKPLTGWNRGILQKWCDNMRPCLEMLDKAGVAFVKEPDGTYRRTQGFGQPGNWWTHISHGMLLKRIMASMVREHGVAVCNHTMALRLLVTDGRVSGALAWNVLTGEYLIIRAKTVVSAQGRTAMRATTNSTRNPFNIWQYPYNTGAGFVLSYDAGAEIACMDTAPRATLLPKSYGAPGMNGINGMGGHELNALGERFMGRYDPVYWENCRRDLQIKATFNETKLGAGPPFFMDMRHFTAEDANHLQYVLMPGDKATYNDWTDRLDIDFKRDLLEVEISEICLGGLVKLDERFETTLPGLYNGSPFIYCSGAFCGGYQAGKEAALTASGQTGLLPFDEDAAARTKAEAFAPLGRTDGLSYQELEEALRNVMDYYMGFQRTGMGITQAIKKLEFLMIEQDRLAAADLRQLMRCLESREILKVSWLSAKACQQRTESGRTLYSRTDFPEENPNMAKPLVLWQDNGALRFRWGM